MDLLQKYFFATDLHRFSLISRKFVYIREICGRKTQDDLESQLMQEFLCFATESYKSAKERQQNCK